MLRTPLAWDVEGSSLRAAPAAARAKLANARLIEPLLHGDGMVGLSGLYAITNAIRLALAHKRQLTGGDVHMLMSAGFRFLSGRLTPLQAFQSGCRISVWRALTDAMVDVACLRLGVHLRIERLFVEAGGRVAAFSAIEQAIAQWRPVLTLRRGGSFTVVSGFTPSSLLLFDSGGACWVTKHVCGVPGDNESARHMLYPASFMALSA